MINPKHIPLALYIHIPWCVRKCPYCDFNSHEIKGHIDFDDYVDTLLADARSQLPFVQGRQISSIFIGGGTPSLLPIAQYERLFSALKQIYQFATDIEVTMEANPATIEHAPFEQYLSVGINRLSIGVQTFNEEHLTALGRIHDVQQAINAVKSAKKAGFKRLNIDLMHGLPQQSLDEALYDIEQAIAIGATHISWYQLTIEPNTVFFRTKPTLPDEEVLGEIEKQGRQILIDNGFDNYEVSAWRGAEDKACRHNVNYWQFGDYLAIGAGAHGKVSLQNVDSFPDGVYRFSKSRMPKDYVSYKNPIKPSNNSSQFPKMVNWQAITHEEIASEFMLDGLRLNEGISANLFEQRTGLPLSVLEPKLSELKQQGLIQNDPENNLKNSTDTIKTTELGRRYLNQVVAEFI